MNYRIEEKPAMLLTDYGKHLMGSPNDKGEQDHNFACQNRVYQYILEGISKQCEDVYQVLKNFSQDGYNFYFAYELPKWALETFDQDLGEMAKNFDHIQIPAGTYLVCETEKCEYPTALMDGLRKQAVTQWLPSSEYVLRDARELGFIHWPFADGNDEVNHSRYSEM